MNNYDEIARQAVKNVTGFYLSTDDIAHNYQGIAPLYQCAYEAAKLQAERFNKDLDDSCEDAEYLEEEDYNTIEDILKEYGFRGKDCSYMLSPCKLELETIEKI